MLLFLTASSNFNVLKSIFSYRSKHIRLYILPIPFLYFVFIFKNLRLANLGLNHTKYYMFRLFMSELLKILMLSPKQFTKNTLFTIAMSLPSTFEWDTQELTSRKPEIWAALQPSLTLFQHQEYRPNFSNEALTILWYCNKPHARFRTPKLSETLELFASTVNIQDISMSAQLELIRVDQAQLVNFAFCVDKKENYQPTTLFEVTSHPGFPFLGLSNIQGKLYKMKKESVYLNSDGIFLGYSHNFTNYWHFTSEVLPRVIRLQDSFPINTPFICPVQTPKPIVELIKLLLNAQSININPLENYIFNKLFFIRDFRNDSLVDVYSKEINMFLPKKEDLLLVREKLLELTDQYLGDKKPSHTSRLFISRNSFGGRRAINEATVCSRLTTDFSFESISPEHLTVFQQVDFFRHSNVVVGLAGASLTNLMFCRPGTRVFVQPGTSDINSLRFWRDFASLFELDFFELEPPKKKDADRVIYFDEKGLFELLRLNL